LKQNKDVIITGNFNVSLEKIDSYSRPRADYPGFTPEEKFSLKNFLDNDGWVDTFRKLHPDKIKYTYWAHN